MMLLQSQVDFDGIGTALLIGKPRWIGYKEHDRRKNPRIKE